MSDRLLIVEDNQMMAALLEQSLAENGYDVEAVDLGFDGEREAMCKNFDLIILDVGLPDLDGISVCSNLRHRGFQTPILMLSAYSSPAEKAAGLNAGADDYLAKPYEAEELVARVRALVRRQRSASGMTLVYEDVELDRSRRIAYRAGHRLALTDRQFAILEYLVRNPSRVLSRAAIYEYVWDSDYEPRSNVLSVHMAALRKKLDHDTERPLIQTVVGTGYRFG